MSESPYIAHVSAANFQTEVIERSMRTLVLVDFWAGWCNPCKMLMPILSAITEELNGSIFLAKVDTDTERTLAEQFGIRSLPTVKLFKQGEVVDEFNGVIPDSAIREFIQRNSFQETDFAIKTAIEHYSSGELQSAQAILDPILASDPSHLKANILAAKIAMQTGEFAKVESLLENIPINHIEDTEIKELRALNSFAKEIQNAPSQSELEQLLANGDNLEARFQLACYNALQEQYESALENFLKVLQEDRNFKDDGARKNILAIFDLLGGSGPLVNIYRIKMSRALH